MRNHVWKWTNTEIPYLTTTFVKSLFSFRGLVPTSIVSFRFWLLITSHIDWKSCYIFRQSTAWDFSLGNFIISKEMRTNRTTSSTSGTSNGSYLTKNLIDRFRSLIKISQFHFCFEIWFFENLIISNKIISQFLSKTSDSRGLLQQKIMARFRNNVAICKACLRNYWCWALIPENKPVAAAFVILLLNHATSPL